MDSPDRSGSGFPWAVTAVAVLASVAVIVGMAIFTRDKVPPPASYERPDLFIPPGAGRVVALDEHWSVADVLLEDGETRRLLIYHNGTAVSLTELRPADKKDPGKE